MSLLAGACLVAASCSDSDEDRKLPSPNFPEAVSATIEAGETYTLEIEPNQDWEASVPTATAAWFWIQDETQKVWTVRGNAGQARIIIGAAELNEFDDSRVCEVTLKMGGQSKVIATITRGTLERGISVRTCKLDEYGDFEYGGEEGLTYDYNDQQAESIDLTWPEDRTDFSMPILVEANYDWAINKMPDWVETPSVTTGTPGTKVEIRIQGNPSAYPLDGAQDKLVFIDKRNIEKTFEIPITIPSCRNIFDVTLDKELKFNAASEIYNSMNGDWSPGTARGSVRGIKGAKIYVIAEVSDPWGGTSLSGDEADTKWVVVEESAWNEDLVIMDRQFTIGTEVNEGDARTARIIVLPVSMAVSDPNELFDYDIKEEYQPYVFATLTQQAAPGPIRAANPEGMKEIGTMFEKLPSTHWSLRELDVDHAYKLTYTKAWSNDPEATLTLERDFTGYKCFDADCQPLSDEQNWLSVRRVEGGVIIDMDREDEGYIVFYDATGNIAAVNCLYDPNADIGGVDIGFAYPEYVTGATLEEITSGEYYEQYAEYGAPIYHLTYEGETTNAVMNVPTYSSFMAQGDAESWLTAESYGQTQIYINMDSDTSKEGVMFLYGANWNVVMVVICTLNI